MKDHPFSKEIHEDSKLVEGLKKIRFIAKATKTLVNINSLENVHKVDMAAVASAAVIINKNQKNQNSTNEIDQHRQSLSCRSLSCSAICPDPERIRNPSDSLLADKIK